MYFDYTYLLSQISKVKVSNNYWIVPFIGIMLTVLFYFIFNVQIEHTEVREEWLQSDFLIRMLFLIILAQNVWRNRDCDTLVEGI